MKATSTTVACIFIAGALVGCKRESDTTITTPAVPPAASSSSSTTTTDTTTVVTPPGQGGAALSSAAPSDAMQGLQAAAQRLRESVQAMSQESAGERRNNAIKQANEALLEVNQAMVSLPPEMRGQAGAPVGSTSSSGVGVGVVYPKSDADYTKAMEKLLKAAQQLRESIQAMAQEAPGSRRDDAIKQAQQALYDTTQSMIQLPPEMRTEKK